MHDICLFCGETLSYQKFRFMGKIFKNPVCRKCEKKEKHILSKIENQLKDQGSEKIQFCWVEFNEDVNEVGGVVKINDVDHDFIFSNNKLKLR